MKYALPSYRIICRRPKVIQNDFGHCSLMHAVPLTTGDRIIWNNPNIL